MNQEAAIQVELERTERKDLKIFPGEVSGKVSLSGAKNSALPILSASLLTEENLTFRNFPTSLLDAQIHIGMNELLGKAIAIRQDGLLHISEEKPLKSHLAWSGRSIRASLLILSALVSRTGSASVPLPGGCSLGDRQHDIHLEYLRALGADVWEENGQILATASGRLKGTELKLRLRSTGATMGALIAGSIASGTTTIWNPHVRPETLDLISLLKKMGASIEVFGQERIEIVGSEGLGGADHQLLPDSLEGLTWAVAAGITGGTIEIENFPSSDIRIPLEHLIASGLEVFEGESSVIVRGKYCFPLEFSTGPHPGINSDAQPILAAWAAHARGESRIIDLRFPGRYGYIEQLARMGVQHSLAGELLSIEGKGGGLRGATVEAIDLRAGAAELLCGLRADGVTTIVNAWQIERGYNKLTEKLQHLGFQFEWNSAADNSQ